MTIDSAYIAEVYKKRSTLKYRFLFEVANDSLVLVYGIDAAGEYSLITTPYTVTRNSYIEPIAEGGYIEFSEALDSEVVSISINRATPTTDAQTFTDGEVFNAESFEYQADKLTLILQEINATICDCKSTQAAGGSGGEAICSFLSDPVNGPELWWKFGEDSGTVVGLGYFPDSSGNDWDGFAFITDLTGIANPDLTGGESPCGDKSFYGKGLTYPGDYVYTDAARPYPAAYPHAFIPAEYTMFGWVQIGPDAPICDLDTPPSALGLGDGGQLLQLMARTQLTEFTESFSSLVLRYGRGGHIGVCTTPYIDGLRFWIPNAIPDDNLPHRFAIRITGTLTEGGSGVKFEIWIDNTKILDAFYDDVGIPGFPMFFIGAYLWWIALGDAQTPQTIGLVDVSFQHVAVWNRLLSNSEISTLLS